MSIFEILMLVCFGLAWPLSIYRSWKSRSVSGKSLLFLVVVFIGYVSGVLHKLFFRYDRVIFLYMLNGIMVLTDIAIYFRNRYLHLRESVKGEPHERADRLPQQVRNHAQVRRAD